MKQITTTIELPTAKVTFNVIVNQKGLEEALKGNNVNK